MKKLFLSVAAFATVWGAGAQFSIKPQYVPKIERMGIELGDIEEVLQNMGLEIYKFSIPADSLRPCDVIFTIDEYRGDSLAGSHKYMLGTTYTYFTKEQGGSASGFCDRIRIFANRLDLQNPVLGLSLVGGGAMTSRIECVTGMPYGTRPFAGQPFEEGAKIPLLMFGSYWVCENEIVRFCGSDELAANDEMLSLSPHYYIVSVELKPAD